MKIFYLVLGSLLFLQCSQENEKLAPKKTVIAGVVNDFSDKANVLVVNFCDPINIEEQQFAPNLIESNGFFHTEHDYAFAQNLTIRIANKFINLFVRPGDSIFISIDANKVQKNFDNAVEFSNDNSNLNNELFIWTNYLYNNYNPQFDTNASPEDFIESVKQNFETAKDSMEAYAQQTNMSDFLKKWAFIDYKFIIANFLMDYDNSEANRWDIFTDPVFDVFNEDNFQTMYFQYHLGVCMNALIQSETEIKRLFSDKEYIPAIKLTIGKLFEKAPGGIVRDVMLFNFLRNILKEDPQLYDSIPEMKRAFSQAYFNIELENFIERNKRSQNTQILSEEEKLLTGILHMTSNEIKKLPDVNLLNFLSENYENKVFYTLTFGLPGVPIA